MDQAAKSMELAAAEGAREDACEGLRGKKAELRVPVNRVAKQRMQRELRAQGISQEAINRLLHLRPAEAGSKNKTRL